MSNWKPIINLCEYLEEASYELNEEIAKTKREASKLQDILDTISPVQLTEKREPAYVPKFKDKSSSGELNPNQKFVYHLIHMVILFLL